MVITAMFDTLQFAKKAKEVGFSEAQAEFQAEEIARIIDENLVTKADFKELKKATRADLKELEKATKADFKELEKTTKTDLRELKKDIIIATGGMLVAAVFVLPVIFKLISLV